ncbi:translational elongation factor EF-1 alpha, partial [Mortierella sp. 14UC]
LKTVFAEHNLQAEDADLPVVTFIFNDENIKNLDRKAVIDMLESVGFDQEKQSDPFPMKLELARAMLMNADILLLDESTNYLDRDSLGALSLAIKEFGGGVAIISHNRELTDTVAVEKWSVVAGVLTVIGNNYTQKNLEKIVMNEEEVKVDAFGNVVKVKSTRKLSRKEFKDKQKCGD